MKMMKSEVNLIENFLSWQGEGPNSGQRMIILRFKTCNRNCSWCDTKVKMRVSAEASYKLSEIQKTIKERSCGILITGGEPTFKNNFDQTLLLLNNLEYPIANVETNGYRLNELRKLVNKDKPVKYIFSPKLFNKNDLSTAYDIVSEIIHDDNVYIKVVFEPDNKYVIKFIDYVSNKYKKVIEKQRVWLMPEGINLGNLIKNSGKVFDACEKYNLCFSSRNHIIFGFI